MILQEVVHELDTLFKIATAEDFDNVGLLCGDRSREIYSILISHDVLEHVVDEALAKGCQMIVTFHPIIFSGLKSITGKNYVEKTVLKALENKLAIYAVHTAFDNDFFGVNYGICNALGIQNRKILMPKKRVLKQLTVFIPADYEHQVKEALFSAGAGSLGFYDECSFTLAGEGSFRARPGSHPFSGQENVREIAQEVMISVVFEDYKEQQVLKAMRLSHPYEEVAYQIYSLENQNQYQGLGQFGELPEAVSEAVFLQMLKEKFNLKVIRHSPFLGKKIRQVGVLGGSGSSAILAAKSVGCEAYITGDVKYHEFFQAENKMLICDIGHFESEQFVTQQLFDIISKKFPKFAVLKSIETTNPVNYFL